MALPTTPEQIHDRLLADATVAGLLGQYIPRDGSALPAIACVAPKETLPAGMRVEGLEVVILKSVDMDTEPLFGEEQLATLTFRIYASEWTPVGGLGRLRQLCLRILELLPGARLTTIAAQQEDRGLDVLDQGVITWQHNAVALSMEVE